jgi:hypothetical protein
MARDLIKAGRSRLQRAPDAQIDPADVRESDPQTSSPATPAARRAASTPARGRAAEIASNSASDDASESASVPASPDATDLASQHPSPTATEAASVPASRATSDTASRPARHEASASTRPAADSPSRPTRRVGRPAGPERRALNVRIRADLDQRLTQAVAETGQSPQPLVEDALRLLFAKLDRQHKTPPGAPQGL